MHLCIDVGNTNTNFTIFSGERVHRTWVKETVLLAGEDALGELAEYKQQVRNIGVASVVPSVDARLKAQLEKALELEAKFLTCDNAQGIKFSRFDNPAEIGADLIAAAIGARELHSDGALIIIDSGTASTITVLDADNEFLGGAIFPGISLQLASLAASTERLSKVGVSRVVSLIHSQTQEAIQAGVYYGHVGAVNEIVTRMKKEMKHADIKVLITGGNADLLHNDCQYDTYHPDLVNLGLNAFLNKI